MLYALLFLVACGSPESTPTPAPQVVQPEPEPEPPPALPEGAAVAPTTPATPQTPNSEGDPPPSPPPALPPETDLEMGAACKSADQCKSGVCEGMGCDDSAPGVCAASQRACTRDRRAFCGCDGEQFYGSSSCVGKRYAYKGMCDKKTL